MEPKGSCLSTFSTKNKQHYIILFLLLSRSSRSRYSLCSSGTRASSCLTSSHGKPHNSNTISSVKLWMLCSAFIIISSISSPVVATQHSEIATFTNQFHSQDRDDNKSDLSRILAIVSLVVAAAEAVVIQKLLCGMCDRAVAWSSIAVYFVLGVALLIPMALIHSSLKANEDGNFHDQYLLAQTDDQCLNPPSTSTSVSLYKSPLPPSLLPDFLPLCNPTPRYLISLTQLKKSSFGFRTSDMSGVGFFVLCAALMIFGPCLPAVVVLLYAVYEFYQHIGIPVFQIAMRVALEFLHRITNLGSFQRDSLVIASAILFFLLICSSVVLYAETLAYTLVLVLITAMSIGVIVCVLILREDKLLHPQEIPEIPVKLLRLKEHQSLALIPGTNTCCVSRDQPVTSCQDVLSKPPSTSRRHTFVPDDNVVLSGDPVLTAECEGGKTQTWDSVIKFDHHGLDYGHQPDWMWVVALAENQS